MLLINFMDWFETCPTWQAVALSVAGIAVIMGIEKLLGRLLSNARGQLGSAKA